MWARELVKWERYKGPHFASYTISTSLGKWHSPEGFEYLTSLLWLNDRLKEQVHGGQREPQDFYLDSQADYDAIL